MIKTLAVKITPETYPVAVACLPGGFVLLKKKLVMGSYLVVNDLQFPDWSPDGSRDEDDEDECDRRPVPSSSLRARYNQFQHPRNSMRTELSLVNFWIPKKTFKKDWKKLETPDHDGLFFEVTRK